MKTVFIGASKFGLRCLRLLLQLDGFTVQGVVTAPRKFSISYQPTGVTNVLHADFGETCRANTLPYVVLSGGMNDKTLFEKVEAWEPELFLVVGWYHMIPNTWLELAPAYGLHASLLPDYSGGSPLVWAMINGEKQTGITLFKFDAGVDSGPILGQSVTAIDADSTIATLYSRIEELGLDLIQRYLPTLADGTAKLVPQDHSKRRVFPQRKPEDGRIDWRQSSQRIDRFVRAQTRPYPGAFTSWCGQPISIWSARSIENENSCEMQCGEVLQEPSAMLVSTGDGLLEILEATYEGHIVDGHTLRSIVSGGEVFGE
jgi:methionyl-tRNA formyltransferase